jgi:hypothetical protein
VVSTGMNPIYEEINGNKVHTKEYIERYMNHKVEKELLEFK